MSRKPRDLWELHNPRGRLIVAPETAVEREARETWERASADCPRLGNYILDIPGGVMYIGCMEAKMQTAPSQYHTCDTCDGRGRLSMVWSVGGDEWVAPLCPACLGAKVFPDAMPAADAIADAETLSRVAWEAPRSHISNALRKARSLGVRVAAEIEYGGGWLLPNVTACEAAHAAFRVVPGLRG